VDSVANIVNLNGLGGTPAATLNFANASVKLMKLPQEIASNRLALMQKTPEHNISEYTIKTEDNANLTN
jgi:hypothetical protein